MMITRKLGRTLVLAALLMIGAMALSGCDFKFSPGWTCTDPDRACTES